MQSSELLYKVNLLSPSFEPGFPFYGCGCGGKKKTYYRSHLEKRANIDSKSFRDCPREYYVVLYATNLILREN